MDEVSPDADPSLGARPRPPRLFTVRLWSEGTGDHVEHRGEVREVATGAYRGFSRWDDLTSFLTEQLATTPPTTREH